MYNTATFSPNERKFLNRLKYLLLNAPTKESNILERLKNLFRTPSSKDDYIEIKGVNYRFFLTPEIIELNKKRKRMLLNFYEQCIENINPDFDVDLLNTAVLPGISERHFYYLMVNRYIHSIDVKKDIHTLSLLYNEGNKYLISKTLRRIEYAKFHYVNPSRRIKFFHKNPSAQNCNYLYFYQGREYFFKKGVLEYINYNPK